MSSTINYIASTAYPLLVDAHAQAHPNNTFAVLAPQPSKSEYNSNVHRKVSYKQLYDAVIRAAHLINPLDISGQPSLAGKVIALVAVEDAVVYQTLSLAITRSGATVSRSLLSSILPRANFS